MIASGLTAALASAAEFVARSEPNFELDQWLAARGVDLAHVWSVGGPICAHDVTLWPRRIFNFVQPAADSEGKFAHWGNEIRAVVHVAHDVDDTTPVDLVAWRPQNPACIYRHLAEAVMLGASQLCNPASYFGGEALPVHRTALDWLAAGCRGVVILDPKEFVVRLSTLPGRAGGYALAAADLAHAKKLRALVGCVQRVKLLVPIGDAA